jgi:hypothetical protein
MLVAVVNMAALLAAPPVVVTLDVLFDKAWPRVCQAGRLHSTRTGEPRFLLWATLAEMSSQNWNVH